MTTTDSSEKPSGLGTSVKIELEDDERMLMIFIIGMETGRIIKDEGLENAIQSPAWRLMKQIAGKLGVINPEQYYGKC